MNTNGQQVLTQQGSQPHQSQHLPASDIKANSNRSVIAAEDIQNWIVTYLADMLEISGDDIETDVSFDSYGLDSSAAVGLTGDLEDWLGEVVDPTILYDYPTIDSLSAHLSDSKQENCYDNN
ncbi:MAG: acyl carrier protein [Cyanobacteria bacterium J06627_28]